MKEIINELENNRMHELYKIGLTPKTTFQGTQEEHDSHHQEKADSYLKAIKVLKKEIK